MAARDFSCIKEFRKALVAKIVEADLEGIEDRVASDRLEKFWPEEEAFVIVSVNRANFSDNRTSPRFYMMEADVYVDIYSRASISDDDETTISGIEGVSDFLDDKAAEIVALVDPCLNSAGPFNGIVKRCVLVSTEKGFSERSETDRGALRITFRISGAIETWNSLVPEDDFLSAKNTITVDDGDGNKQEFTTELEGSEE